MARILVFIVLFKSLRMFLFSNELASWLGFGIAFCVLFDFDLHSLVWVLVFTAFWIRSAAVDSLLRRGLHLFRSKSIIYGI